MKTHFTPRPIAPINNPPGVNSNSDHNEREVGNTKKRRSTRLKNAGAENRTYDHSRPTKKRNAPPPASPTSIASYSLDLKLLEARI